MNEIMREIPLEKNEQKRRFKGFFEKNSVIAPVFFDEAERKQAVLVHINPITMTAELYYRPNVNHDNSKL